MKKTVIAALLGATLLTGGALAAVQDQNTQDTPRHMMRDPLTMADANRDGVVTRDELTASVAARFARIDTDKDGKITVEERQAARAAMGRGPRGDGAGKPGGKRGRGMGHGPDANGDGVLTLDEQRAQALKRFDFIDRNGDGKIDQAERDTAREMMREMRAGRHHGGDTPPLLSPAPSANGS